MEWKKLPSSQGDKWEAINPKDYKEIVCQIMNPIIREQGTYKTRVIQIKMDGKETLLNLKHKMLFDTFTEHITSGLIKANTFVRIVNNGEIQGKRNRYYSFDVFVTDGFLEQTGQSIPKDNQPKEAPKEVQAQPTQGQQLNELYVCVVCSLSYWSIKELQEHQSKLQHTGMRVKAV